MSSFCRILLGTAASKTQSQTVPLHLGNAWIVDGEPKEAQYELKVQREDLVELHDFLDVPSLNLESCCLVGN